MKASDGYFKAKDGTELYYKLWQNPDAKNVCILIHGYGNHSSRYQELVELLSDLPYSFYSFDLRGQGRSRGERVYANDFNDYQNDCYDFCSFLRNKGYFKRETKPVLFGHSLGGLIATRAVLQSPTDWKALVLSSPCFKVYGLGSSVIAQGLVNQLSKAWPHLVMSNFVKPRFLFHGKEKLADYMKDRLIERRVTLHLAQLITEACQKAQNELCGLNLPLLVLASDFDRVVDVEATRSWFSRLETNRKRIKFYPNLYHEIFSEENNQEPVQELKVFLREQAGG